MSPFDCGYQAQVEHRLGCRLGKAEPVSNIEMRRWFRYRPRRRKQCTAASTASEGEIAVTRFMLSFLHAVKMLWVAVVAGTPAIRRISSRTVRVGECSAAYKEASFAGSTRHDIHQVSVEYLARIIRRIIELEGPIHQDEIVIRVRTL